MKKYIISLLVMILIVILGVNQVESRINTETKNKKIVAKEVKVCNNIVEEEVKTELINTNIKKEYIMMKATGYDLSIRCCGKSYTNPSRGITKSGYNLNNKSHSEAWTVSSNKYPMGTKLKLEFPESHSKYSGVYTVRDTGNFKENVLDVYVGDFGEKVHKNTISFGRVDVKVSVVN